MLFSLFTTPITRKLGLLYNKRHSVEEMCADLNQCLTFGTPKSALKVMKRMVRLHGVNPKTIAAMTGVLFNQPDQQLADNLLAKLQVFCPSPQAIALARMHSAIDRVQYDHAIQVGDDVLREHPRSPRIVNVLASALALNAQFPDALQKIKTYHKTFGAPVGLLGKALEIANERAPQDTIVEWTQLLISVHPDSPWVQAVHHENLLRLGKDDEARNVALSVKVNPGFPPRPYFRAVFNCIRSHEYERAAAILEELEGIDENAFERTVVAASLALRTGDLAGAAKYAAQAGDNKNADRRMAVILRQLAEAYEIRGGRNDKVVSKAYHSQSADIASAPIANVVQSHLNKCRETLNSVLATTESKNLLANQPYKVSYICPVHRSADVQNIIQQVSQQNWRNAEVLFLINGEVTKNHVAALWDDACTITPVYLECHDLASIGDILNEAVRNAQGEYICRMDADNLYFPNYASHMMCCLHHFKADFIAKGSQFRHLQSFGIFIYTSHALNQINSKTAFKGGGGTHFFHRKVFDKVKYESLALGEDLRFLAACLAQGFSFHNVDPFNFVTIRKSDAKAHTWQISDVEILYFLFNQLEIVGMTQDVPNMVTHPTHPNNSHEQDE